MSPAPPPDKVTVTSLRHSLASPLHCIVLPGQHSASHQQLLCKGSFVTKMWSIHPRSGAWLDNEVNYNTSIDCVLKVCVEC